MMRALSTIAAILFLLPCFGASPEGRPTVSVDTIADLVARNPVPNERVLLSGFRTAGDFGPQRIVRHDPDSVASTNLGCVYSNAGTGRYLAEDCEGGEVKPEWFGAVAGFLTNNTVSPSTVGINSTLALQGAIDYVSANGGGQVKLSKGIYWTTNTLFLKPRVVLRGIAGAIGLEEIRQAPPTSGDNSRMTGASYISGESDSGDGFPLIVLDGRRDFTGMYNSSFVNVDGQTVYYYSTGGCAIYDIGFQMYDWQFGQEGYQYPNAGIVAKEIAGLNIERCAFLTITGHGVYLYGAQGTTIRNCVMHTNFEPGIFVAYTSDVLLLDNILSTCSLVVYRANTIAINRNTIYNTRWSWVNNQSVSTNLTSWGVTRSYLVERDYGSDAANDTFYTTNSFGAGTGTMVFFTGTNLPAPFTTTNVYFVCNGPTDYTIRLATTPANAFSNVYVDITESKVNGDWSLTSPNATIYAYDSEEILAQQNRLDQSFEDTVVLRKLKRSTFTGNQIWEPGLNQTVFRLDKNTHATNVSCVLLDKTRDTLVDGNLMHGYYTFSLNNTLKQVATYGVRAVASSDILISGNSYARLSYGAYADADSVNVISRGNSASDNVAYRAFSEVTNRVNSHEWDGVYLGGTNLLLSSAIPDAKTNITDFTLCMTLSHFDIVGSGDGYVPLALLSSAVSTNFTGVTIPDYSLSVFGFQNSGQTNLQLVVNIEAASGNRRRGTIPIREWYDKKIPLELIVTRSGTNWYVFRNGYYEALSMTVLTGGSPPAADQPIHGKYMVFGGWYANLYYDGWLHSFGLWDRNYTYFSELRDHLWRNGDSVFLWDFRHSEGGVITDRGANGVNGTVISFSPGTYTFGPKDEDYVYDVASSGFFVRTNKQWVAVSSSSGVINTGLTGGNASNFFRGDGVFTNIVPIAPTSDGAYILFVTNGVASWIAHP